MNTDMDKVIKKCGYNKAQFADKIGVSRPTLNKALTDFKLNRSSSNPALMILFSRLSKYERINKKLLDREIAISNNGVRYMYAVMDKLCDKNFVLSGYQVERNSKHLKKALDNFFVKSNVQIGKSVNREYYDELSCGNCNQESVLYSTSFNSKLTCVSCGAEYHRGIYDL